MPNSNIQSILEKSDTLTLALYREYSSAFFGEFMPDGGVKGSHGLASSYPKTCLLGFLANSMEINYDLTYLLSIHN